MKWKSGLKQLFSAVVCLLLASTLSAAPRLETYQIKSDHQPNAQRLRVLLPDSYETPDEESEQKPRMLYVLPVEEGSRIRWGDSLQATLDADLHNRYQVVCVFPEFAQLPWYADHPTDREIQQESYLLEAVIPFVDEKLDLQESEVERYLVGFSKSGWGAFSLLLRHPDKFHKAAAWDAPLMMDRSGLYGSGPIFGDESNFRRYQISRLIEIRRRRLQGPPRLISLGYDNFRGHLLQFHKVATELNVAHIHRDGPQRRHHWESGWLSEAAELLFPQETESITDTRSAERRPRTP